VISSTVSTLTCFVLAAGLEIAGCFGFWAWLRGGRSPALAALGAMSLVFFAVCLTRVESAYAGRAFAAYGGVYIASSLLWLRYVEGVRPDRWDIAGGVVSLAGALLIVFGRR
jgi:small multidrug resistance family-3 protein